jgi:hypothetical protein
MYKAKQNSIITYNGYFNIEEKYGNRSLNQEYDVCFIITFDNGEILKFWFVNRDQNYTEYTDFSGNYLITKINKFYLIDKIITEHNKNITHLINEIYLDMYCLIDGFYSYDFEKLLYKNIEEVTKAEWREKQINSILED